MSFSKALSVLAVSALLLPQAAAASDVAGKWAAEFDTQVGVQKYTYEFALNGDVLSGKASYERMGETGQVELTDCKLEGDAISFMEALRFQGMELAITYSGTVKGDEIELTRQVGDVAEEKLTATRVTE
jgi:hypothetical protein